MTFGINLYIESLLILPHAKWAVCFNGDSAGLLRNIWGPERERER